METMSIDLTGIPETMLHPRQHIQKMIRDQDLRKLMERAAEFHGHLCSFVTLGLRAGVLAVRSLGEDARDGMEQVTCIIECNNCFSDGIQISTGCTFGNNSLIYRDVGKNAFTLIKRGGKAFRVFVRPQTIKKMHALREQIYPGGGELFEKVVAKRSGSIEETKLLKKIFLKLSYESLSIPDDELLTISETQTKSEKYAPIHNTHICSVCGEPMMESRARLLNEQTVCIPCAKDRFFQIDGSGIRQKKIETECRKIP